MRAGEVKMYAFILDMRIGGSSARTRASESMPRRLRRWPFQNRIRKWRAKREDLNLLCGGIEEW